jgi:hypothetical protein
MRTLTQAALAAKLVRKELRQTFPNTKFKVHSQNYSMCDSINIYYDDELSQTQKDELHEICERYQYGHFDGMTDSYENDNDRGMPQSKYVFAGKVQNLANY